MCYKLFLDERFYALNEKDLPPTRKISSHYTERMLPAWPKLWAAILHLKVWMAYVLKGDMECSLHFARVPGASKALSHVEAF